MFSRDYQPGSNITLTINNLRIFVATAMETTSWNMTTFTPNEGMIERLDEGLSFVFGCNAPCLTCDDNDPDLCLSCNDLTTDNIFYEGKCYSTCPDGSYYYV
eukprot:CAMPEP_0170568488 /NCGR_PEP_ID=MMETSP0211-20121228/81237_1 /TAXON_ID=311385 /ORGANISM="Pseudokeronopsis sp., Strain OXSARD2" /LENGTH=101 /DNA_ID=CAMNT_0010890405 /DNA_START=1073 /DNA_END=1375 /DNA_ORIENTATION=+